MTYPNLRAEIARRGLTTAAIAQELGITRATLSAKLNGRSEWTLEESKTVKTYIGTSMPLELLFKKED